MKAVRAILGDRKRAQRGSILSGVLIMVAFLAIISGALLTELSTHFLISRVLVNRVANQATVNSAMELAIDQLQQSSSTLNSACPGIGSPMSLNGRTAVVNYFGCAPVPDRVSLPQFPLSIAGNVAFNTDGTHAGLTNDYLVGNANGTVLDYSFGSSMRRWRLALGGAVSGPVLVMRDPNNPGQTLDLIPVSGPSCPLSNSCVSVRSDDGSPNPPGLWCPALPANGAVVTRPAAGSGNFPSLAFFGDSSPSGSLAAYDMAGGGSGGDCVLKSDPGVSAGAPIVGGPVVFPCRSGCSVATDEVYVLTAGQLVQFTYSSRGLAQGAAIALPWANATGLAVEPSATSLPARLAISFGGGGSGGVAVVQINPDASMSVSASVPLPPGAQVADSPYWCSCPGPTGLIGVGASDGGLYLFDTSLNAFATYPPGGASIITTPSVDGGGNWYFGATDGYVYEVQALPPVMTLAKRYGCPSGGCPIGKIGSSVQVGGCPSGICIYFGSVHSAYYIALDARDAVMSACLTTSAPTCSSDNPRLWSSIEVGATGSPQTVHVLGWSYYSP